MTDLLAPDAHLVVEENTPALGETARAWFSPDPDRTYRYALTRRWDPRVVGATFIMCNPSTADAFKVDPTVRRCIGYARDWGCGGLLVLNLFALRSTDPKGLYAHADPIGPDNDQVLTEWAHRIGGGGPVVAAWSLHGAHQGRGARVAALFRDCGVQLEAFGVTKNGQPLHPLRLRRDAQLTPWETR